MDDDSKVDLETTAEFFRAATEFDWSWGAEDIQRFSRVVGWETAEFGTDTTIVMTTNAQLEKPLARFEVDDHKIHQVTIHLTDFVDASSGEFLLNAFATASTSLQEILGPPVVQVSGRNAKLLWDKPNFIGELVVLDRNVIGSLIRRDYQPIVDELEARGVWS